MPCVATQAVPARMPEATAGGLVSNGIAFLLSTIPAASQRASASAPVRPLPVTSARNRWVSVPPDVIR
jgi:hypothetical protein